MKPLFDVKTYECYGCGETFEDPNNIQMVAFSVRVLVLCQDCQVKLERKWYD